MGLLTIIVSALAVGWFIGPMIQEYTTNRFIGGMILEIIDRHDGSIGYGNLIDELTRRIGVVGELKIYGVIMHLEARQWIYGYETIHLTEYGEMELDRRKEV